jgi:hypothetical protein
VPQAVHLPAPPLFLLPKLTLEAMSAGSELGRTWPSDGSPLNICKLHAFSEKRNYLEAAAVSWQSVCSSLGMSGQPHNLGVAPLDSIIAGLHAASPPASPTNEAAGSTLASSWGEVSGRSYLLHASMQGIG